jgi:hypothetical protein
MREAVSTSLAPVVCFIPIDLRILSTCTVPFNRSIESTDAEEKEDRSRT